eukprot:scaffold7052_cov254-Pinguiococcus_pyrenoidosus.AAC.102
MFGCCGNLRNGGVSTKGTKGMGLRQPKAEATIERPGHSRDNDEEDKREKEQEDDIFFTTDLRARCVRYRLERNHVSPEKFLALAELRDARCIANHLLMPTSCHQAHRSNAWTKHNLRVWSKVPLDASYPNRAIF